jgi:hypothetical protein
MIACLGALGDSPVIWAIGATREEAILSAARAMAEGDGRIPATITGTEEITEEQAEAFRKGERKWPMGVSQTKEYSRVPHAAHYVYGHPAKGHDLERIDVNTGEARCSRDRVVLGDAAGLPSGYAYHSGYVDANGHQHWIYTRTAPLSPEPCARCAS